MFTGLRAYNVISRSEPHFHKKPHPSGALNYFGAILKDYELWAQAQIAAIVEYFGLGEDDGSKKILSCFGDN